MQAGGAGPAGRTAMPFLAALHEHCYFSVVAPPVAALRAGASTSHMHSALAHLGHPSLWSPLGCCQPMKVHIITSNIGSKLE